MRRTVGTPSLCPVVTGDAGQARSVACTVSLISSVSAQKTTSPRSTALPPERFCAYHEAYMLSGALAHVQLVQVAVLKTQFSLSV